MTETNNDFEKLDTWKKAHQLMLKCYNYCKQLPDFEKYNRISQLQRSSSSVPANISEGCGRYYFQENIAFCRKARGSLDETRNHIIAARDLEQAPKDESDKLIEDCIEVRKLINGYIRYLNKSKPSD